MAQSVGPIITKSQACRLLGITRQWLNRLIADGAIPNGPRGQVPLVGAVQGYLHHLQNAANNRGGAEAARISTARAIELETRNSARSTQLVPIWEAAHAIDLVVGLASEELQALPDRIKAGPEDRTRLGHEVVDACARIAETRAASYRFLKTGGALVQ